MLFVCFLFLFDHDSFCYTVTKMFSFLIKSTYQIKVFAFYIKLCSKTCLKQPLKNRQNKGLNDNGSLMKVESIAECSPLEHFAILLTCI